MKVTETNIGSPEQWAVLEQLHPGINRIVDGLVDLATEVAMAQVELRSLADRVVFALSRICIEECYELLLLAANDYDLGTSKLLRSLYERAVTSIYINKCPEKAQRFVDYGIIQNHRLIIHAKKIVTSKELDQALPLGALTDLEKNYEQVKDTFKRTKCKKCKTTEISPSWDVDLATMAEKAGEGLTDLYVPAYAETTLQIHTTLRSTFARMAETDDRVTFDYAPDRQRIVASVIFAIALLTSVLEQSIMRFSLPLADRAERLGALIRGSFVSR